MKWVNEWSCEGNDTEEFYCSDIPFGLIYNESIAPIAIPQKLPAEIVRTLTKEAIPCYIGIRLKSMFLEKVL